MTPAVPSLDKITLLMGGAVLLCVWWWLSTRRPPGLPPGPGPALPLLGHLHLLGKDPRPQLLRWRRQYGDVFSLYLGGKLTVVLASHSAIKEAFVTFADVFSDRPHVFIMERIMKNKGIASSSGPDWKDVRKTSLRILRDMGMGRNVLAERVQEEVTHYIRAIREHHGAPVDVARMTQVSVSNNICSIVWGKRFHYDDPEFVGYIQSIDRNLRLLSGTATLNFLPFLEHVPGDPFQARAVVTSFDSVFRFIDRQLADHRLTIERRKGEEREKKEEKAKKEGKTEEEEEEEKEKKEAKSKEEKGEVEKKKKEETVNKGGKSEEEKEEEEKEGAEKEEEKKQNEQGKKEEREEEKRTGGGCTDFLFSYLRHVEERRKNQEDVSVLMDEETLRITVADLFIAGTETTSTAISWALLLLLHHPRVQDACFKEIRDVIGPRRAPAMSDRLRLPYLEATIQEVLRKAEITPLGVWRSTAREVTFRGHVIPKDTIVIPDLNCVLQDDVIWGDPENFRPERFIGPDGKLTRPEELIPFSLGRRVCLGESLARMELFLYLANLIQHFRFLPPEEDQPPSLQGVFGMTHTPQPYKLRAVRRK